MADIGLDYAGSSPGAAAVKAAGYNFVARYLSRYAWKTIKQPEYDDMTGNGVGVVLVFEDYADQALKGYDQGVADAQVALAQANSLGFPGDRPIYFAVDFDIAPSQKPVAGEYMKGIHSVIGVGRTGAYGGYWWIKYCVENGLSSFNWQAVAWSGGLQHPNNHLFQRLGGVNVGGTGCDVDDARQADYGQNNAQGVEEMITPDDVDVLRIGHSEIGGWDFNATHTGQNDALYLGAWQGKPVKEFVRAQWQAGAGFHDKRNAEMAAYPGLVTQVDTLTKDLDAANAEIKTLQDQINSTPAPTPTPPTPPVDPTPTPDPIPTPTPPKQSFWDWIKSIFGKK
jgi:hypothetical protein